jgi:hypothetical protein
MKTQILMALIGMFVNLLSPENLRKFADLVLDAIENKVEATENKWDDAVILPMCQTVRDAFNIPDNDEPPE